MFEKGLAIQMHTLYMSNIDGRIIKITVFVDVAACGFGATYCLHSYRKR
jgi:hypothetical protein